MIKLRRHLEFLDEEKANELVERFQNKKRAKNAVPKGIDFLQRILNITDKDIIIKQLADIPSFETDSDFTRANNCIVLTYIVLIICFVCAQEQLVIWL